MSNQKKAYEEVFSSDFSEASDYESEIETSESALSSAVEDLEKTSKKITRDFWLKKQPADSKSKKATRKKGEVSKSESALKYAADSSHSVQRSLAPLDFVKALIKIDQNRSKAKGSSFHAISQIRELAARASAEQKTLKVLAALFLFDALENAFNAVNTSERWSFVWENSISSAKSLFDILADETASFLKEFENLPVSLNLPTEEDELATEMNEKRLLAATSKMGKTKLFQALLFLLSSLAQQLEAFKRSSSSLEHLERIEERKDELESLATTAKRFFVSAGEKDGVVSSSALLLSIIYDAEKDNVCVNGGSPGLLFVDLNKESFEKNDATALALFVVSESKENGQRVSALVQLAISFAKRGFFEESKTILSRTVHLAETPPLINEKRKLKVLMNRAQCYLGICAFQSGRFDEAKNLLDEIYATDRQALGLKAELSAEEFDKLDAAYCLSAIFREAEGFWKNDWSSESPKENNFLRNKTNGIRDCASECLERLRNADWEGFAKELIAGPLSSVFGDESSGVYKKLCQRAKETAMYVFLSDVGGRMSGDVEEYCAEAFDLSEEKAGEIKKALETDREKRKERADAQILPLVRAMWEVGMEERNGE